MKPHRPPRRIGLSELVRRLWWQWCGERAVLIVFWPRDYKQGEVYNIDGRFYRITRYFHASDYRFYEVWGYEIEPRTASACPATDGYGSDNRRELPCIRRHKR